MDFHTEAEQAFRELWNAARYFRGSPMPYWGSLTQEQKLTFMREVKDNVMRPLGIAVGKAEAK
jgi:hypothetical protein